MSDDQETGLGTALLRYGVAIAFIGLYLVAIVGGFVVVITATGWVDEAVLQPAVGGSTALSAVLLGAAILGYVLVVYQLTTSGSVVGTDRSTALSSLTDADWGEN